jgi:hypothetical protein
MTSQHLEGWCTDPYDLHEARWFSDDRPTKLVRDEGVESYEEPPSVPFTSQPVPVESEHRHDASDLIRADDPESQRKSGAQALFDVLPQIIPPR